MVRRRRPIAVPGWAGEVSCATSGKVLRRLDGWAVQTSQIHEEPFDGLKRKCWVSLAYPIDRGRGGSRAVTATSPSEPASWLAVARFGPFRPGVGGVGCSQGQPVSSLRRGQSCGPSPVSSGCMLRLHENVLLDSPDCFGVCLCLVPTNCVRVPATRSRGLLAPLPAVELNSPRQGFQTRFLSFRKRGAN